MKKLSNYLNLAVVTVLLLVVLDSKPKEKFVGVVEQVIPAVVEIHVVGTMEVESIFGDKSIRRVGVLGSGVFISKKGYILTCAHLFDKFTVIESISVVSSNDDTVSADIVNIGTKYDLAIIKAGYYKSTPRVKIADPRHLKIGQEVFAIGSPLGLSFSVTSGIISSLYRDLDFAYNVTQSDTSINPGNSGGPLFNLKGELIGINSFMIPPLPLPIFTGLGFSVQCSEIRKFITDTKKIDKGLVL